MREKSGSFQYLSLSDQRVSVLMGLAATGDTSALNELVVLMVPVMRQRIRRALRIVYRGPDDSGCDTNDILQHACTILLTRGDTIVRGWKPDRGLSISGFFGLFAQRVAQSWSRSGRLSGWAEYPVAPEVLETRYRSSVSNSIEQRDLLKKFCAVLGNRLNERGVRLFLAITVDDQPASTISKQFRMSTNAVYCARRRFRELARAIQSGIEK